MSNAFSLCCIYLCCKVLYFILSDDDFEIKSKIYSFNLRLVLKHIFPFLNCRLVMIYPSLFGFLITRPLRVSFCWLSRFHQRPCRCHFEMSGHYWKRCLLELWLLLVPIYLIVLRQYPLPILMPICFLCRYFEYIPRTAICHVLKTLPFLRIFLLSWVDCRRTVSPSVNGVSSRAPRSCYFFWSACLCLMRSSACGFISGCNSVSPFGRDVLVQRLSIRCAGLVSWVVCGVFRTARCARYTSSPDSSHVPSNCFACLTADSALPLGWW